MILEHAVTDSGSLLRACLTTYTLLWRALAHAFAAV